MLQQPGIELWDADGSHPSLKGSYLAACMFYAAVFGESPVGSKYFGGLDSTAALFLQQIAGSFVTGTGFNNTSLPTEIILDQNYPNPFNPATTIRFRLNMPGDITIKLYDAAGKETRLLVNAYYRPGIYSISIDAFDLPSGVYFYTLVSGSKQLSRKMIFLK